MDDADTNTKNRGGKQEMKSVFTLLICKMQKRQKFSLLDKLNGRRKKH